MAQCPPIGLGYSYSELEAFPLQDFFSLRKLRLSFFPLFKGGVFKAIMAAVL